MTKALKAELERLAAREHRKLAAFIRIHLEEIAREEMPAPTEAAPSHRSADGEQAPLSAAQHAEQMRIDAIKRRATSSGSKASA